MFQFLRGTALIAAFALNSDFAFAAADFNSANYIMPGCRVLLEPDPPKDMNTKFLSGQCKAMIDRLIYIYESPSVCPPNGTTLEQWVRVVVKYIDDRPARLHEHFFALALEALRAAWPCQTLGTMKHNCERLELYWRQHPPTNNSFTVPDDDLAAMCAGFMTRFSQASRLVDSPNDCPNDFGPNCHPLLHVCIPKSVSEDQILSVFLAYARSHPAQWHEQATSHFQAALAAAFPCKGSAQ
jgi:hypothetical protein